MLSCEFRISDITVWTIHFVGESLNDRFSSAFVLCGGRISFFLFFRGDLNIASKARRNLFAILSFRFSHEVSLIDSELLRFGKDFDDIFFQSAEFLLFQGQTVKNSIALKRKITLRDIRLLKVKIFNRVLLFRILRKEEIPCETSAFFYFLLIVFYKFQ